MNSEMKEWALRYAEAGFSVIPVNHDKKPIIKWEPYQKRKATKEEIEKWWTITPTANIGIVTGSISGVAVVDIDTPDLKNEMLDNIETLAAPPISLTPRGGRHQWYAYPHEEVRNTTGMFPNVDFRGEGGYVLVPPSTNGNGKPYSWKNSILDNDLPILPKDIIYIIKGQKPKNAEKEDELLDFAGNSACQHRVSMLTKADKCSQMLTEGRRDDDLFHIANCLVKGGAKYAEIMKVIEILAKSCTPQFPIDQAMEKIKSALNRTERKERTIMEDVRNWCMMQEGFFSVNDCCIALAVSTRQDKNAVYTSMGRLVKEELIEKYGKKSGCYRRIERDVTEMDWENAPTHDLAIDYPLGIADLVRTYPSNIIIVAGTSNAGKTAFLLDFARRNASRFKVHYFNSEMGLSELKMRLDLFQGVTRETWRKIKFYERGDNFVDVIDPNGINVIDYLEVLDEFWKVGAAIKGIHDKLKNGIAVIAIQKNKGADLGRGGALGLEKPRLYLNIEHGNCKIIKAKNWRSTENPSNMSISFKLAGGWKIIPDQKGWCKE